MVGSGIASAFRKPAGPRGSWLKQGRAGHLSPRHLCTHTIGSAVLRPELMCATQGEENTEWLRPWQEDSLHAGQHGR